jgi:hypothetical protein
MRVLAPTERENLLSSFRPESDGKFLLASCEYCLTKHVVGRHSVDRAALQPIYQSTCPRCLRIGFHAQSELEISDRRPSESAEA